MGKIKEMKPVVMVFMKEDGKTVEVPLTEPKKSFSKAMEKMRALLGDEFPKVTIGYDCIPFRHGRVLKNVKIEKRRTPVFHNDEGEEIREDVYDIYWESEEPFSEEEE
jgi:hypothetical protein